MRSVDAGRTHQARSRLPHRIIPDSSGTRRCPASRHYPIRTGSIQARNGIAQMRDDVARQHRPPQYKITTKYASATSM